MKESALTIGLPADPDVQDTVDDPDPEAAADAFDELAWLIWPTDGLEGPLAAGAFRILTVDSKAAAETEDRGLLTWTVVVKLTNVEELPARCAGAPGRGRADRGQPRGRVAARGRPLRAGPLDSRNRLVAWAG